MVHTINSSHTQCDAKIQYCSINFMRNLHVHMQGLHERCDIIGFYESSAE
jgi:hypothetical protein